MANNLTSIIGGAVAGAVFVLVVLIAAITACAIVAKRRKKGQAPTEK